MSGKNHSEIALIINTRSRRGERFFFRVLDLFISARQEVELFPIRRTEELNDAVKTAIRHGNKKIIIGGGDGTISAMIGHFVHKDIILGILPLGTANSFIRSLRIPNNPEEAVKIILQGKVTRIDVGKVNERYYANAVSFGYTTAIAEQLSTAAKRAFGIFAYVYEGIRQTFRTPPFRLKVKTEKGEESFSTYQVIVANGSYYGLTPIAEQATVNSHKLVLLPMKEMGRLSLFWAWVKSLFGQSLDRNSRHDLAGTAFTLIPSPAQAVSIDGELYHARTLHFSVVPEAVQVMVPKEFRKQKGTTRRKSKFTNSGSSC